MVKAAVAVLLVLVLGFITSGQVAAQTPEPTPSPTPSYMQAVTMSTGSSLLIIKSVSYGDIAVTIAVMALLAVELVKAMVDLPKKWLKK